MVLLDDIFLFDRNSLVQFIAVHSQSSGLGNITEELEGIAISILLNAKFENLVKDELRSLAANIGDDPIFTETTDVLLESSSYQVTPDLVIQIIEIMHDILTESRHPPELSILKLEYNMANCKFDIKFESNTMNTTSASASLILVENYPPECFDAGVFTVTICLSNILFKRRNFALRIIPAVQFGLNEWMVRIIKKNDSTNKYSACSDGGTIQEFHGVLITYSTVYTYCRAADEVFDILVWGWGYGGKWTEELESSLVELLVCVDEDLLQAISSWESHMRLSGMSDELTQMSDTIRKDISAALQEHTAYAVGRLHQTIAQLLEATGNYDDFSAPGYQLGMSIQLSAAFKLAAKHFIATKIRATPFNKFEATLALLLEVLPSYIAELPVSSERSRLERFISEFDSNNLTQLASQTGIEFIMLSERQVHAFRHLRPDPFELIMGFNADSSALLPTSPQHDVCQWKQSTYMPSLPVECIRQSAETIGSGSCYTDDLLNNDEAEIDRLARKYSEILLFDIVNVGSLFGTKIGVGGPLDLDAQLIRGILNAGFSYVVTTGGKLVATLPLHRSVLLLRPLRPFHEMTPGYQLSVYFPSYDYYPVKIRKRVKELSRIFRNLKSKGYQSVSLRRNSSFDLALQRLREHHGDDCWIGPELEAVWRYMAALSPPQLMVFELWLGEELVAADFGHMTAGGRSFYVATRFFDRTSHHVKIIQPGGIDLCPLMRYKIDLTGSPMERPIALANFLKCRALPPIAEPISFPQGNVLIQSMEISDIICGVK